MNPNNAAIATPVAPVINYLPLTIKAPALGKAADALATKAAISEVNRAINVAYYNGIL